MLNVVLYAPRIPQNTGQIARACWAMNCRLHLVRPLGFTLEDRQLQRAGMDYAEVAEVRVYDRLDDCLRMVPQARVFAIETGSPTHYAQARFEPCDALLFGSESSGLPAQILAGIGAERTLSIPMRPGNRSLNLANSVALVVYEAWRQQRFAMAP